MAEISFTSAYATSVESVTGLTPDTQIYAEDLGNCGPCISDVGSCWPCLLTTQQVFSDINLSSPVVDGYYLVLLPGEVVSTAVWHIVGGYPQEGGYMNPPVQE
jgi:hypothetical protein